MSLAMPTVIGCDNQKRTVAYAILIQRGEQETQGGIAITERLKLCVRHPSIFIAAIIRASNMNEHQIKSRRDLSDRSFHDDGFCSLNKLVNIRGFSLGKLSHFFLVHDHH